MSTRRSFFRKSAGIASTLSLSPLVSSAIAEDVSDALLSLNKLSSFDAMTDEELWEAIQHVSRNYDFGDAYGDIYDWAVEKAQERKESENA